MRRLLLVLALLIASPAWAGYANVYTITINHTLVPSDQSPYVLTFHSTLTALKTQANGGDLLNASGYDYRFTSNSTTCNTSKLYWEEVGHNITTGELEAHIHLPSGVSASSDTLLYLCTGNASVVASEAECVTGSGTCPHTWTDDSAGYLVVSHYPNGSSLDVSDSVGTVTPTNHSGTASTGILDGVLNLVSASNQYVDFGAPLATTRTLESWITAWSLADQVVLNNYDGTNGMQAGMDATAGGHFNCWAFNGGSGNKAVVTSPATGSTSYYLCTHDGTNIINRTQAVDSTEETNSVAQALGTATQDMTVGRSPSGQYLNSKVDEVRISSVVRSDSYFQTHFNNICWAGPGGTSCTTAFYTVSGSSPLPQGQALIHSTIY